MHARFKFWLTTVAVVWVCGGCASQASVSRPVQPEQISTEQGWVRVGGVPEVLQVAEKDCGAAALSAVLRYWGKPNAPTEIDKQLRKVEHAGLRAGDLRDYARSRGLSAYVFFGQFSDLTHELRRQRPVIVGTVKPQNEEQGLTHYEIVLGHHPQKKRVLTWDPALGLREHSEQGFEQTWSDSGRLTLVVFAPNTAAP